MTQFDPKQLERGLVCSPAALPTIIAGIISVKKISYFKGNVHTKAKFHITMGHETVMGRVAFFGSYQDTSNTAFDFNQDYKYQDELISTVKHSSKETDMIEVPKEQYALLEFEKPVTCASNCLVIGSKLDTDIHSNVCRIAFHGQLLVPVTDVKYSETILPQLRVYKDKMKEGMVERKADDYSVICRGLFKKESKIDLFVNMKVRLSTGEEGVIEGSFGQSGKFKVRIPGTVHIYILILNIRLCLSW